ERLRASALGREEDLEAQGHAGEAAREDDNGERLEADEVDAPGEPAELEGWDEDQGHRLAEESAEAAERRDDVEGEPPQRLDETQGQRPGRWPRSYISPRLGRSCLRQLGRPSSRKTRSCRRAPVYPEGPEGEVLRVEVILEVEDTRETRAVPERVFPRAVRGLRVDQIADPLLHGLSLRPPRREEAQERPRRLAG